MQISGAERALAVLGYLGPLFIIPVKVKRDSMFVQFHGRQGGVLFGLWFIYTFILFIVLLFTSTNEILSTIFISLAFLGILIYVVMALIAILKVVLGERYRMPLVADVALKLGL